MQHAQAIGTIGRPRKDWIKFAGRGLALAAFGALLGAAGPQSPNSDGPIVHQLDAAEIKTRALEGKLAAENKRLGSYRVADLFGESDEEKAARLQHEQSQDSSITGLNQRMGDVEESLRRATGQIEQLDHRIDELNSRIERMQKDFDYKLCTLAAQQLGASGEAGEESALPCPGTVSTAPPPAASAPPPPAPASSITSSSSGVVHLAPPPASSPITSSQSGVVHLAPPPGVLGTLPANNAPRGTAAAPALVPPPAQSANRPQFEAAMNLLAKAQYDEARSAFRAFADAYPKDELTPQAVYWIGDIAYVQKDYAAAARAFVEEIKKYPSSPRAPESMLKLGQSLIALNQKQEGCTTLAALPTKYPNASKTVVARAAQEHKAAACR
jgi:tol-pal system protein YbgF